MTRVRVGGSWTDRQAKKRQGGVWVPIVFDGAGLTPLPAATVQSVWVGGVTSTTAQVTAKLTSGTSASVRLDTTSNMDELSPVVGPDTADADDLVTIDLTGLTPNTLYYYRLSDSQADGQGSFRTHPTPGAASFAFVHGSCQHVSNGVVWERIAARNPRFLLHLGDLHYQDIQNASATPYVDAIYDAGHTGARFRALARTTPIDYMPDDHDALGNIGDKTTTGQAALWDAYRRAVPHHTLPGAGMWHSFVYGRVRFVVTDLASGRDPIGATDNSSKSMMGAAQKTWFKAELSAAKAAGQVVAWVSTKSWVATAGDDSWFLYSTERTELANYITTNAIKVFILSGDIHSCAIDDGTNSAAGVPEFAASPFDQFAFSGPTGPWSHGGPLTNGHTWTGTGPVVNIMQYGLTTITDNGTTITVDWKAYHSGLTSSPEASDVLMASHSFVLTP